MTDAPLGFVSSADNQSWSDFKNLINGYSAYGMAMTMWHGELWGIMTQTVQYPGVLFANKYSPENGWQYAWRTVSESWRAQGRTSVTVLDDFFYMTYRGLDNGVYLVRTSDQFLWADCGRVGGPALWSGVSPAVAAYKGKLIMVGTSASDKAIHWCVADPNQTSTARWTKIPGWFTAAGLELCVHRNKLYMLVVGLDNKAFYSATFEDGQWSPTIKVVANITSGIGATSCVDGTMIASYKGDRSNVKYNIFTEASGWGAQQSVAGKYMNLHPGACTMGGLTLISYPKISGPTATAGYDGEIESMNEKVPFRHVDEDGKQWECRWEENSETGQKGWVRTMLCL